MIAKALLIAGIAGMAYSGGAFGADRDATITAIDAAIHSLQEQPSQFTLNVRVTGMQVTSNGSGPGMVVTAQGGSPGSRTVGVIASTSSGDIQIAQAEVTAELRRQADQAIQILQELKADIEAPKMNKPGITAKLQSFGKLMVAPALQAVIGALVTGLLR